MHLKEIIRYLPYNCLDYVLINNQKLSKAVANKYKEEGAYIVRDDLPCEFDNRTKIIRQELLSEHNFARHNSEKLAKLIMDIIHKEKK
jgi:2-phospho-L-lactate transferase/gluconeogenesis factor (CofD/UPF0052 family)